MAAYYYIVSTYDSDDLCLNAPEPPVGPFGTADARYAACREDMAERDAESSQINVAFLKVENGHLACERRFVVELDGEFSDDFEGDEDEEDE